MRSSRRKPPQRSRAPTSISLLASRLALVVFSLLPLTVADAAEVTVRASAQPAQAFVGERIQYVVTITHPTELPVRLTDALDGLDGVEIEQRGTEPPRQQNGGVVEEHWAWIASFRVGAHRIPAPVVTYRASDGTDRTVRGEEVTVTIASLLPAQWEHLDIREIRSPIARPPTRWWLLALPLAGLALLAWSAWRRRFAPVIAPSAPPTPAHVTARRALEALRREGLLESQRYEPFFVRLSAIVRHYIEGRFGVRAPDMTTEEFLQEALRGPALGPAQQPLLREFLTQADLVKFARYQPSVPEAQRALAAAERFINETAASVPALDGAKAQPSAGSPRE